MTMSPHRVAANPAKWKYETFPPIEGLVIKRNNLFVRMLGGVVDHFPVRVQEWIMALGMLGWGWAMWLDPMTFDKNPSLSEMARLADESTWSLVMVGAGFLRLFSLLVNGTFRETFRFSPHLRGYTALLACFIWGQITLGILVSYFRDGGVLTGFVAYGVFMLLDLWNLLRAWADVGRLKAEKAAK